MAHTGTLYLKSVADAAGCENVTSSGKDQILGTADGNSPLKHRKLFFSCLLLFGVSKF